jgi:hypothetical protein
MDSEVRTAWLFVAAHDLHPGAEHPTRKGWFLQYQVGPRGEPMWYRPPSLLSVWIYRMAFVLFASAMLFAVIGSIVFRL